MCSTSDVWRSKPYFNNLRDTALHVHDNLTCRVRDTLSHLRDDYYHWVRDIAVKYPAPLDLRNQVLNIL